MALTIRKGDKEHHYTLVTLYEKGRPVKRQIGLIHVPHHVSGHPVPLSGEALPDYVDLYTGESHDDSVKSMDILSAHGFSFDSPGTKQGSLPVDTSPRWSAWQYLVNWIGAIGCFQLLIGFFDAVANALNN